MTDFQLPGALQSKLAKFIKSKIRICQYDVYVKYEIKVCRKIYLCKYYQDMFLNGSGTQDSGKTNTWIWIFSPLVVQGLCHDLIKSIIFSS